MLKVENIKIALTENNKIILDNVNLTINPGEIHLLNGRNGSGKSTLVNTIMGNPGFKIISGKVSLEDEEYSPEILQKIDQDAISNNSICIGEIEPNERANLGLFLANQYPLEIPGVGLSSYLRLIHNNNAKAENKLSVVKFRGFLDSQVELINYPRHLLKRNLNEGFSGGEKKKTEILQMLILKPRYIFLDEIDSGLDKNSTKEVFEGLSKYKKENPQSAIIVITHYDKVQEYLTPNYIHDMDSLR